MTRQRALVRRLRSLVNGSRTRRFVSLVAMWAFAANSYAGGDFRIEYSAPSAAEQTVAGKAIASAHDESLDPFVSGRSLIGDGSTDNTLTLRKLLSVPGRTVVVPPGDYVTGSFLVASDTTLVLERGVTLRDGGHLGPDERLMNILGRNVRVVGYGARLLSSRKAYTSGEQRHGVFIFGAENVTVEGLESGGHGGDGFYIGGSIGHPSSEIRIVNCTASNNRRQGLSVTNASDVLVQSSSFIDTAGTAPQAGIDLEPNDPTDRMEGIRLVNVRTENNAGGGILVALGMLGSQSQPVDVLILGHQSSGERVPIRSARGGSAPGSVRYVSFARKQD